MLEQEDSKEHLLPQAQHLVRTALWVSMMDDAGGKEARVDERRALVEAMRRQMREKDYKPLYPVLEYAIEHHKAWESWAKDVSEVMNEIKALKPEMTLIDRQCLYDLAYNVATRFRERGPLAAFMAGLTESFRNFLRPQDDRSIVGDYVRISHIEKSALNELADVLELPRKIIR